MIRLALSRLALIGALASVWCAGALQESATPTPWGRLFLLFALFAFVRLGVLFFD